jgi:hypothetical protein
VPSVEPHRRCVGTSPVARTVWPLVQARYTDQTGKVPANSEQGEIKLLVALFRERQLAVERSGA